MQLILGRTNSQRVGLYRTVSTSMIEIVEAIVRTHRYFEADGQPGWFVLIENWCNDSSRLQSAIVSVLQTNLFGPSSAVKGIVAYSTKEDAVSDSLSILNHIDSSELSECIDFVQSPLEGFQPESIISWMPVQPADDSTPSDDES